MKLQASDRQAALLEPKWLRPNHDGGAAVPHAIGLKVNRVGAAEWSGAWARRWDLQVRRWPPKGLGKSE